MRAKGDILARVRTEYSTLGVGLQAGILEALLDIRDTLVRMGPSDYALEQNRLLEEDMQESGRARAKPGKKKVD